MSGPSWPKPSPALSSLQEAFMKNQSEIIFEIKEKTANSLIMIYRSSRAMHHFGLGLMKKTFEYFNVSSEIKLKKLNPQGTRVEFNISKSQ